MIHKLLAAVFISFLFFGCSGKDEIQNEKLVKIYVDLMVVQQLHADNSDSLKIGEREVFKKYDVTKESYENSLKKYSDSKEKWEEFFTKSKEYLDTLKAKNDSSN